MSCQNDTNIALRDHHVQTRYDEALNTFGVTIEHDLDRDHLVANDAIRSLQTSRFLTSSACSSM